VEKYLLENINRNLEVIIGLLLRSQPDSDSVSLRDRVLMLKGIGMRPKDIARILGKSPNHINKELSVGRSATRKVTAKK